MSGVPGDAGWVYAKSQTEASKQTIVLCHGVFDRLHPGHIEHLREAAKLGDKLIVSITADNFVDKGPGRPVFSQDERRSALMALACVDQVEISNFNVPYDMIKKHRPHVYVKGIDYAGTVIPEAQYVTAYGGRVAFTKAKKFSSTRFIAEDRMDDGAIKYVSELRDTNPLPEILSAFETADTMEFAFIGDAITDVYEYVRPLGKTSKEYTVATCHSQRADSFEGGVIAASRHAEWKHVILGYGPSIMKKRYVDEDFTRKLFEVYMRPKVNMYAAARATLMDTVVRAKNIICFDFGHGTIDDGIRREICGARFVAVNAQANAGNHGFNTVTKYGNVDLACVDEPEARLATGKQFEPIEQVIDAMSDPDNVIVTHGRQGCWFRRGTLEPIHMPALTTKPVDTMGAGDAFLAVAGPLLAAGLPLGLAAFCGNVAGMIKVGILGHKRHVGRHELITTLEGLLQ